MLTGFFECLDHFSVNEEQEVLIGSRLLNLLTDHLHRARGPSLEQSARAAELLERWRMGDYESNDNLYRNIVTTDRNVECRRMAHSIRKLRHDLPNDGQRCTRDQRVVEEIHSTPGGELMRLMGAVCRAFFVITCTESDTHILNLFHNRLSDRNVAKPPIIGLF